MTNPRPNKAPRPVAIVVIVIGLALLFGLLWPSLRGQRSRARSAECPINLETIAQAQDARLDTHGSYLACASWPAAPPQASQSWEDAPDCWTELGFARDFYFWGQYTVTITSTGWEATCRIDTDGDGDYAQWSASDERTAGQDTSFED